MIDIDLDKFKEECGIFSIYATDKTDVASVTYYGLCALQHRGQESTGIAVTDGKNINCYKDIGLVSDVFNEEILDSLKGFSAIGHVRYSTTGSSDIINAQPLICKYKLGNIAIAHNGNLINANIIREILEEGGCTFQTSSDSEVILRLIARAAKKGIQQAVVDAIQLIKGSFAIVILTQNKLIGVRDHNGIRPLCIGKLNNNYIMCSESCALDAIGAEFIRDVQPGEIAVIDKEGVRTINFAEKTNIQTCAFEYIYFARPDSVIDGISVHETRLKAGQRLYEECPVEADIVIGVPDSGIAAAMGFAKKSGISYGLGFVKNKYVGRTFICPSQELREKITCLKLNVLKGTVFGKRVVVIDDSIVRGTTSRRLVQQIRKAGAKEVHVRISSPIVKYPCYFGIDTPCRQELIGSNLDLGLIRDEIGADTLGYLSIEGLLSILGKKNSFCLGCFNGVYPVSAPIENSKECLEEENEYSNYYLQKSGS